MSTKTKKSATVFESGPMGVAVANIDEVNHVIKHVKILGKESLNGRDYSGVINKKTAALYENASVYAGHVKTPGQNRNGSYGDRVARIRNVVPEAEGMFGDLHYNPKHYLAPGMVQEAKDDPNSFGLSHHADLIYRDRNQSIVESIDRVYSVDLVNRPATTNGLFESENPVKTFKQVLESLPTNNKIRAVFEEMMAGGVSADMPVDAPVGGQADDQIKAAFRSAVTAAFDDDSLDSKATLAKIKSILNAYDKLNDKGEKNAAPAESSDKPADEPAKESVDDELKRLRRESEVRKLADKEGVKLSDVNLKAACALESADDRAAFIKDLPKPATEAVKGTVTKPKQSGSVLENADDAPTPPTFRDNESRLAFLRGR